uniref:KIB1-4 beta-propeller domain-containing protein n=1 Tax=Oryza brachyantha TaxID=4533 RepID=J3N462_ORYBR
MVSRALRPRRAVVAVGVGAGAGRSDWSSLQVDLLRSVLMRLAGDRERARFGAVGSRADDWSGLSAATVSSFWLSQGERGLAPFDVDVPAGSEYLSSSRGYLALWNPLDSPRAITLFNPVTGRRIRLPPIGFFKRWHDVATIVLSDDPDTAEEWSAVAVGFPANSLAWYSSATGEWTPLSFSFAGYAGVEHFRRRFYVAFKSQLCVLELDGGAPAVIPLELQAGNDDDHSSESGCRNNGGSGLRDEDPPSKRIVETHLVECDGELLVVSMHDEVAYNTANSEGVLGNFGRKARHSDDERWVDVHRVQWLEGGAVRLVRVQDLGSHALFVGRNHAFALSPEEFPACRANCIYAVEMQGHPGGLVRVLNFNDDSTEWAFPDEDIFPDDGAGGSPSAAWARRGWVFPKY